MSLKKIDTFFPFGLFINILFTKKMHDESFCFIVSLPHFAQLLRSFYRFAVRSSSAHEGKIIIFERFQCSLTKTIQLN